MKTMFNKSKTKAWIKEAHKDRLLTYGHGYITNGHVLLMEEPHMQPVILEVYGTLSPECRYPAETLQKMMDLPGESIEVIDSQLEYTPKPKHRLRIFYDPTTGKELAIDGNYFDLLDNPKAFRFYTNNSMDRVWIMYGDDVVGLFAPVRLQDQLSHVRFRVEEEEEQV
jgi:hypothetical protein